MANLDTILFSEAQMAVLSKWDENFRTFHVSKWSPWIGSAALKQIHEIYTEATGDRSFPFSTNCSNCMGRLFHAVVPIYLRTAEKAAQSTIAEEVAQEDAPKKKTPQKPRKKAKEA